MLGDTNAARWRLVYEEFGRDVEDGLPSFLCAIAVACVLRAHLMCEREVASFVKRRDFDRDRAALARVLRDGEGEHDETRPLESDVGARVDDISPSRRSTIVNVPLTRASISQLTICPVGVANINVLASSGSRNASYTRSADASKRRVTRANTLSANVVIGGLTVYLQDHRRHWINKR